MYKNIKNDVKIDGNGVLCNEYINREVPQNRQILDDIEYIILFYLIYIKTTLIKKTFTV